MIGYMLPVRSLRVMLFLMGVISPRAFAAGPSVSMADVNSCPKVILQVEGVGRCTEGEQGCLSDEAGQKFLRAAKKGCEEGRGGEGSPCLYGIFISAEGKATAVCGPRPAQAAR